MSRRSHTIPLAHSCRSAHGATPCSWWSTKVGPARHVGAAHSWFAVDPLLAR
jgi:hypothetical protein